ncbi:MAG: hypothetical protein L0H83_02250 [Salinisphaera sp.]|nr:hypothetical protein [Salinisphaera sp.]
MSTISIGELSRMEAVLSQMHAQCSGRGKGQGCPIIETLSGHGPEASAPAPTMDE